MNYQTYSKLYDIYAEEKNISLNKQILKLLFLGLFYFAVFFYLLIYIDISSDTLIAYYLGIHFTLQSLLLFVYMVLYESTSSIVSFCRNVPINPKKLFLYHFFKSNIKVDLLLEYIIVSSLLLYAGAPLSNILLMLYFLFMIKLIRTYIEFFILWFKKYQMKFPYLATTFFLVALTVYFNLSYIELIASSWSFTYYTLLILSIVLGSLVLFTYPYIISSLIKERSNNKNAQRYNKITNKISTQVTQIFAFNLQLKTLVNYHLIRLLRDSTYIGKLLAICTTIITFNIASNYLPFMQVDDLHTKFIVEVIYIGFFINFLYLLNVKVDYKLQDKLRLNSFPLGFKFERLTVDIVSTIFVFVFFNVLLLLKVIVENIPFYYLLQGYKSFFIFLMLGLIVDCIYKYQINKKEKVLMMLTYFLIGVLIEALLIARIAAVLQILLIVILISVLYVIRYRKGSVKKHSNKFRVKSYSKTR